jgi:hypothetical protein
METKLLDFTPNKPKGQEGLEKPTNPLKNYQSNTTTKMGISDELRNSSGSGARIKRNCQMVNKTYICGVL